MNHDKMMNAIHEIFDPALPRLAPGDDAVTRRALDLLFNGRLGRLSSDFRVLDVGCGNGQASLALTHHFHRVHASDPSAEQIANAPQDPRITWRVESAEICSLHNHSADLVTAAQAYHWFNPGRFASEAAEPESVQPAMRTA